MARVLWLSNETPDPQGQGGQRRQFFQLREVASAGHDVTLCTLAGPQSDAEVRAYAYTLRTEARWLGRVPSASHHTLLRRLSRGRWDAVVLAHTQSWLTFRRVSNSVKAPVWADLHNVLGRDARGHATRWATIEREISARASTISVCSELERERLISQQRTTADVLVMSHGIDMAEWGHVRRPSARPVVKMFGNWDWGPNRRGLNWFLSSVWPSIDAPGARCEIAGTGVTNVDLPTGVEHVGRVASLSKWMSSAWVVVVPVVRGVGAPVKYLEALASGAPVISTLDGAPMARAAAELVSNDPYCWIMTLRDLLHGNPPPSLATEPLRAYDWRLTTAPLLDWLS